MFGLTGNNPANDPDKKPIKSHSKFLPNYSLYQTMLYGWNQPHFAMEVVGDDKINLRCQTDIDTYNLKAPLMFPVKMYHDYFFVPLRAILPHNMDLLITNPLTGEDVVPEDVNAGFDPYQLAAFLDKVIGGSSLFGTLVDGSQGITGGKNWWTQFLGLYFTLMPIIEYFGSYNSLLNVLGYSVEDWMFRSIYDATTGKHYSVDYFVEQILDLIRKEVESFQVRFMKVSLSGGTYTYSPGNYITVNTSLDTIDDARLTASIGWRQFLRLIREGNPLHSVSGVVLTAAGSTAARWTLYASDLGITVSPDAPFSFPHVSASSISSYASKEQRFVNIQRLVAYQLVNAQFYTNDAVDYIYNADLYHQNQRALAQQALGTTNIYSDGILLYDLNGTKHEYDSCSGKFMNAIFGALSNQYIFGFALSDAATITIWANSYYSMIVPFLANVFGYQRSLKYRDYFVGSKCRPLAVGDVTVNVSSNMVNVVDITRNIMRQRFFNQVNRLGRSLKEYSRGIFGVTPMTDPREPILLASTCDIVGASEQDSTDPSANMSQENTTTSKLRNSSSKFAFEINPTEFGVLIGITHFDAVRPYVSSTDRTMMHVDRFDMFNPFMQNTGDQAVHMSELCNYIGSQTKDRNFGYQLRYAEYKQRVDRAVGGFAAGLLPGYSFPIRKYDLYELDGNVSSIIEINPDFIRARAEDFDQFYASLTHYSLAGYFHFLMRNDLEVSANRPMEAAPTIL